MARAPLALLHLGTQRTVCHVGVFEPLRWKRYGSSTVRTAGWEKGFVTDADALMRVMAEAISQAEEQSKTTLRQAWIILNGAFFSSRYVTASMDIPGGLVTPRVLSLLVKKAHADKSFAPVHAIPLAYHLEHEQGVVIESPLDMYARHIAWHGHVIGLPQWTLDNLVSCFGRLHLQPQGLIFGGYAVGTACLTEDEKQLGATLIEWGGASTTVSSFFKGKLVAIRSVPVGSRDLSYDLAQCCGISLETADHLKHLYGIAGREVIGSDFFVINDQGHDVEISMNILLNVIKARLDEIHALLQDYFRNLENLGYVFTAKRLIWAGGGSHLKGLMWWMREKNPSAFSRLATLKDDIIHDYGDELEIYSAIQWLKTHAHHEESEYIISKPTLLKRFASWIMGSAEI